MKVSYVLAGLALSIFLPLANGKSGERQRPTMSIETDQLEDGYTSTKYFYAGLPVLGVSGVENRAISSPPAFKAGSPHTSNPGNVSTVAACEVADASPIDKGTAAWRVVDQDSRPIELARIVLQKCHTGPHLFTAILDPSANSLVGVISHDFGVDDRVTAKPSPKALPAEQSGAFYLPNGSVRNANITIDEQHSALTRLQALSRGLGPTMFSSSRDRENLQIVRKDGLAWGSDTNQPPYSPTSTLPLWLETEEPIVRAYLSAYDLLGEFYPELSARVGFSMPADAPGSWKAPTSLIFTDISIPLATGRTEVAFAGNAYVGNYISIDVPSLSQFDVQATVAHELGHVFHLWPQWSLSPAASPTSEREEFEAAAIREGIAAIYALAATEFLEGGFNGFASSLNWTDYRGINFLSPPASLGFASSWYPGFELSPCPHAPILSKCGTHESAGVVLRWFSSLSAGFASDYDINLVGLGRMTTLELLHLMLQRGGAKMGQGMHAFRDDFERTIKDNLSYFQGKPLHLGARTPRQYQKLALDMTQDAFALVNIGSPADRQAPTATNWRIEHESTEGSYDYSRISAQFSADTIPDSVEFRVSSYDAGFETIEPVTCTADMRCHANVVLYGEGRYEAAFTFEDDNLNQASASKTFSFGGEAPEFKAFDYLGRFGGDSRFRVILANADHGSNPELASLVVSYKIEGHGVGYSQIVQTCANAVFDGMPVKRCDFGLPYGSGEHEIELEATTSDGLTSVSGENLCISDTPVWSSGSVALRMSTDHGIENHPVSISASTQLGGFADSVENLEFRFVSIDGAGELSHPNRVRPNAPSHSFEIAEFSPLPEAVTVIARARNHCGVSSDRILGPVYIDRLPPEVTLSPREAPYGEVNVKYNKYFDVVIAVRNGAADPGLVQRLRAVKFEVDSKVVEVRNAAPDGSVPGFTGNPSESMSGRVKFGLSTGLMPGSHELEVTAYDQHGNRSRQRLTFTVAQPPLVQCGVMLSGTGGNEGYSAFVELPPGDGTASISFSAAAVPDRIRILDPFRDQAVVFDSGCIGSATGQGPVQHVVPFSEFTHDGFVIEVTPRCNPTHQGDTIWTVNLSCTKN